MPMISLKDHQGFSMVEVLVTLAITIIGLVGLASLQLQASRSASDTGNRSQAVWIIEDLTNRIRANTGGLENYDTGGFCLQLWHHTIQSLFRLPRWQQPPYGKYKLYNC